MPWFFVDDGLYDHPKLALLPAKHVTACVGLWTLAGTWSRRKLTGGFVPRGQVERLGGTQREAGMLVSCGLWEAVEGGYRFHQWEDWQETPEDVAQRRDQSRERTRKWRENKRHSRHGDGVTTVTGDAGNGVTRDGVTRVYRDPSPSPSPSPGSDPPLGPPEADPEDRLGERLHPQRLRFELEELVRSEFFARNATPQKASAGQWLDGCRTVQEAMRLGVYPDVRSALEAFARDLVDAVAAKKPPALGLALQQVQLGAQLRPALAGGRQLSPLALAALERRRAGEGA